MTTWSRNAQLWLVSVAAGTLAVGGEWGMVAAIIYLATLIAVTAVWLETHNKEFF